MTAKTLKKVKTSSNLLDALLKTEKALPSEFVTKPDLKPVWDKDLCSRCALCYIFCPDAAISRQEDGYYNADMNLCTGCSICHRECWFGAISMQEED